MRIARATGVTDNEIERVQASPDAPGWSAADTLLLQAADELHADACITDATWARLAVHYDERQMIELSLQGFSTQEISEQTGRAERSVRRLRERVRKFLERQQAQMDSQED